MRPGDRRRLRRARMAALGPSPALGTAGSPAAALAVVRRLGALQAQDYGSGAWSLGVRSGLTLAQVEEAVRRREIVRTWPMRGTIHWVAAEDARWMARLLAGRAIASSAARRRQLGLSDRDLELARGVFEEELREPRSRPDVMRLLGEHGVDPTGQRGYHVVAHHCMTGQLCQGPVAGRQQTFVLVDSWVPKPLTPTREEAMVTVVERYVRGHGPVLETDVSAWLGATLGFVREALAMLDGRLVREEVGGRSWLRHVDAADGAHGGDLPPASGSVGVHLLPQWDELLLGYRSRDVVLGDPDVERVVPGRNLQFRPTVVLDGEVVGTWRRREAGGRTLVEAELLRGLGPRRWREVERAAAAYGRFLGRDVHVRPVQAPAGRED